MSEPENQENCPTNCPNRRNDNGICLFGKEIDPVEILVHFAIVIVLLVPASRRSVEKDFSWKEAMGWFGAIVVASAVVRLAPTDRIDAYTKLFK